VYLPVTAVLGGRLFVTAEGYEEAVRDVVRLCADVAGLLDQEGPVECAPLPREEGGLPDQLPLHCSLLVTPAPVCPC